MSALVLKNASITVNAVDLSAGCMSVQLPIAVDEKETTNFGSGGWKEYLGGLKDAKVTIDFNQDFAASQVDATIWAALGTVVAVTVKATNATTSATNPEYQFNALISQHDPVDGKVGDVATTKVTWPVTGAITRAVA